MPHEQASGDGPVRAIESTLELTNYFGNHFLSQVTMAAALCVGSGGTGCMDGSIYSTEGTLLVKHDPLAGPIGAKIVDGKLTVLRTDPATPANISFQTPAQSWLFQNNQATGVFSIRDETLGVSPFKVFALTGLENTLVLRDGKVGIGTTIPAGSTPFGLDVNGSIYQRGSVLYPDYVFEPGYPVESIDEHAAFMWTEKHLPALPRTWTDGEGRHVVELGAQQRGMLEELEKAHIYIEDLHRRLETATCDLEAAAASGTARADALERENRTLRERLERIEAALDRVDR